MEDSAFQGFGPEVFEWFAGLERDNTKAYFTATRDLYEDEVRGGLEAMLDELAMTFGGEARVFRQQRDLRFTPDKTPYKTRTYGVIYGTSVPGAGLYAQLSVTASTPARATGGSPATSSSASAPRWRTTPPGRGSRR